MSELRRWALVLALVAVVLATGLCAGSGLLVEPPPLDERIAELQRSAPPDGVDVEDLAALSADDVADPPGLGITSGATSHAPDERRAGEVPRPLRPHAARETPPP